MLMTLVNDISNLIDKYGLTAVRDTVDFVGKHSEINTIKIFHADMVYKISRDGYNEIAAYMRAGDKIAAIKRFRELRFCGLKEAKDIIESRTW